MTMSTRMRSLEEGAVDLGDRRLHKFRRVVGDDIVEALRESLGELVHFRLDFVGDRDRVRVRQQRDRDAGGRSAVEIERFAVGLRAELGVADVAHPGDAAAVGRIDLDDDVLELSRIVEPALEVERILEVLAFRRGRRADLSGRDLLALLLDDVDDVLRRQSARLQKVRVQPNAHGVLTGAEHRHVADAGKATQFVLHVDDGVVRQEQAVEAAVRRVQDRRTRGSTSTCFLVVTPWSCTSGGSDEIAADTRFWTRISSSSGSVPIAKVTIRAVGAVARARRLHVDHVLDAVDVLLDRQSDGVDERHGACAGITRRHLDGRRDDVRILGARQVRRGRPGR